MTYPEPQNPDKEPDYSFADDELVGEPFYRKQGFYIPLIVLILFVIAVVVIVKPFGLGKASSPAIPSYEEAVLTFPDGTTDWRLSPETRHEWPNYLCLIDDKWHKCTPVFISPTLASTSIPK